MKVTRPARRKHSQENHYNNKKEENTQIKIKTIGYRRSPVGPAPREQRVLWV
tara:strand:+ start:335 stop:490 length:156 start_codon:yes stop_codon:yes gene_type:complete